MAGDNEVHQRSFSCPTPQTSSRTSTLEFGGRESDAQTHQRSASHDPNSMGGAAASSYDPEAMRNVAQHMYSETRRHCRGLTRARSRSGLALSLEDLASVGLTEERERKRREREARERERQRDGLSHQPPRMHSIDSSSDTPQMIHRLLGERFPGVHYGSVTPSRIGGRYGSIANLDIPQDTQQVHYDSENSVDRFARRFRRREARRGRYNSSVSLDTGRFFEAERNFNRQNNDVSQQQHQQQEQQHQLQQEQQQHQQTQHQQQQQPSENSLKRRHLISLGKTPSFISRILVSTNATTRTPDSCDEQLLKPSDLLYTYRFTEDGGFEVGVVGENAEISTDFAPASQEIVRCENSNGEVVYSLDSSTSSSLPNTFNSSSYLYDVNTPEGIELRMDPDNGAVLYSRDLDGGGLSGIYV